MGAAQGSRKRRRVVVPGHVPERQDWAQPAPKMRQYVAATAGICKLKSMAECRPTVTVAATAAAG